MTQNQPPCPVCAGISVRPWFEKAGYSHHWCPSCHFGFVDPVPTSEELANYYQRLASGLSSHCSWETEPAHKRLLWKRMLDQADRLSGKGPVLDLGCGAGQFLRVAESDNWHPLTGIEISETAAALARQATSACIHQGDWSEIDPESNTYAAAALMDVLEHAPHPAGLLRYVWKALRSGGSVLLTVPNARGLSIRCFGAAAAIVIPPEHLSYFSRMSLSVLLDQQGFAVEWLSTCDLYLKEWMRFLPGRSTHKAAGGEKVMERETYARWYGRMTGRMGLAFIRCANVPLAMTGLGEQLVCVARKRD